MAVLARDANKPFYVAVESYKFVRDFPLNQADIHTALSKTMVSAHPPATQGAQVRSPSRRLAIRPTQQGSELTPSPHRIRRLSCAAADVGSGLHTAGLHCAAHHRARHPHPIGGVRRADPALRLSAVPGAPPPLYSCTS